MQNINFNTSSNPIAAGADLWAETTKGLLAVWFEGDGFGGHRAEIILFKNNDLRDSYSSRDTQDWPELESAFPRALWLADEYGAKGIGTSTHPQLLEAFNAYKAEMEADELSDI